MTTGRGREILVNCLNNFTIFSGGDYDYGHNFDYRDNSQYNSDYMDDSQHDYDYYYDYVDTTPHIAAADDQGKFIQQSYGRGESLLKVKQYYMLVLGWVTIWWVVLLIRR